MAARRRVFGRGCLRLVPAVGKPANEPVDGPSEKTTAWCVPGGVALALQQLCDAAHQHQDVDCQVPEHYTQDGRGQQVDPLIRADEVGQQAQHKCKGNNQRS